MKYLHTMVRVSDVDKSMDFYCNKLGLKEVRRMDSKQGRFTLIYLAAPGDEDAQVELTYNWDPENYGEGRNFGHIAFEVDDLETGIGRVIAAGGSQLGEVVEWTAPSGAVARFVYLTDPEGNIIDLFVRVG